MILCLVLAGSASASGSISSDVSAFATGLGYGSSTTSIPVLIVSTIRILLGVLGLVFFILILYGGFMYMMSAGEPDKTKKAKNIIVYAAIGVFIIALAYGIATFVISVLPWGSGDGGGGTETEIE